MANEGNYKGITVKFGADPTPLSKAMRDIDAQAKGVSADIKEIEKGLKVDPKNIDLTVQKIKRLGDGIQTASRRLEMLKAAQADARRAIEEGSDGAEQRYKDLQREITRTGNELERLRKQARDTGEAMKADMLGPIDSLKDKLDDLKKKSLTAAVAAVGAGLIGVTKSAVENYAEYEQLVGGVETLFKESSDRVVEYAKNAYKTAGLSANDYLETVTSFSASLLQGLDGDTAKAAKLSDQAITDMADNANKMGTSIESIQNAYQGFAKQNYTMLDNLKLGYGGTASEMARLINDSGVLGDKITVTAKTVNSVSFDKMIEAIHVVQTELGITGTTAQEAEKTISGSLNSVKAAWSNLMTGLGDETADTEKLTENFTKALDTFIDNVKPVLKRTLQGIGATLSKFLPEGLVSGLEFLYDVISRVGGVISEHSTAVIATVGAYKAFKTAVSIAQVIETAIGAVKALTAANEAAAVAQQGVNAAAAANPYGLIAVSATAAAAVIAGLIYSVNEADTAFGDFFDKVKDDLEKNNEAVRSYDELSKSISRSREERQRAAADIEGEYYGYEKLIARLYELDGAENKSSADKAEMAEIVDKLQNGIEGLTIAYNKETGELTTQRQELEKATAATKEFMLAKAAAANQEGIASDLAAAELDLNKLEKEYRKAAEERRDTALRLAEKWNIDKTLSPGGVLHELYKEKEKGRIYGEEKEGIENDIAELESLNVVISELGLRENAVKEQYKSLGEEFDENAELIGKYSERLEAESEAADRAASSAEELTDEIDEQSDALGTAKTAAANFSSELSGLIAELERVSSGTKYSTVQVLDLIEKYPELAKQVRLTADGYELEADSIRRLIEKKAELAVVNAREEEERTRTAANEAASVYTRAIAAAAEHSFDTSELENRYKEAMTVWQAAKDKLDALEAVSENIGNGRITSGTSSAGSTSSASGGGTAAKTDTADYWKQAAEQEIAEAEHLYKLGELSAEEYYSRLEDINRRYYENRSEYLSEYRKLAETVYSGLKKQQEDQLSNMKTLLERINAVRDAKRSLENAENQKVSVYSSAAGFHIEDDRAAIEKAADSLQSKTLELASLLQQKYGMNISMPDISGFDLSALLPDLSGLRIPGGTASNRQVTVNYQAGDIYISGSADSGTVDRLRALMNSELRKFFEEYLTDYLDRADMDRQTGG